MWTRQELKERGKAAFRANYWPNVLVAFILSLLTAGATVAARNGGDAGGTYDPATDAALNNLTDVQAVLAMLGITAAVTGVMVVALLLKIFVFNPLKVGCYGFFKENVRSGKGDLNVLVTGFNNYGRTFVTLLLADLFVFLWTLLLIVPGIVKSYSYRMVPFIIRDDPELDPMDAIKKSRVMMAGNKWAAFKLDISFLGWGILTVLTMGLVGIFWANPYYQNTNAALYLKLRGEDANADINAGANTYTNTYTNTNANASAAGDVPPKPEWEL